MHDRKVAIIKNKKCYMSSDYVRNILNTYRGRNKYYNNSEHNDDNLIKIEKSQYIDICKEKPVILYNKLKKRDISTENQVKKELADNFGYLNNSALKYHLIKFYSVNISNENLKKNNNKKKTRNKLNNNTNLLFKSLENDDKRQIRQLRIKYSDKLRKRSNTFKKSNIKNNLENKLYKRINNSSNKLDKKKLANEENMIKLITNNIKKNDKINNNNINDLISRKKGYLDINEISYKNIVINENEKNNEKEEKRKVKLFKDGKYIKKPKPFKNVNNMNVMLRKKKKNLNLKDVVDAFEYMKKIKNEINHLKNTNNK